MSLLRLLRAGRVRSSEMADSAGLRRTRPTEKKRAASVDLPDLQPDLQPDDARQHTSGTPPLAPRPVAQLSAAAPATASAEPLSNDTVTPAVGGPGWRTPAGFQAAIQRAVTAAMAPVETKLADMAKLLDQLAAENASLKRDLAASSETQQRALMAEQAEGHRLADRLDELQRSQRSAERTQRSANLVVHCLPETDGVSPEAAFSRASADAGLPETTFLSATRLGRQRQAGGKPRPLLVKLPTEEAKHELFGRSQAFRQFRVFLDDDLSLAEQASRRSQMPDFMALKRAGLKPYWRLDRILYNQGGRPRQHLPGQQIPAAAGARTAEPGGLRGPNTSSRTGGRGSSQGARGLAQLGGRRSPSQQQQQRQQQQQQPLPPPPAGRAPAQPTASRALATEASA